MAILTKIFKLILLLTILNACIPLQFDTENTNFNLKTNETKSIEICFKYEGKDCGTPTDLEEINDIKIEESIGYKYDSENDKNIYITIFPYGINEVDIECDTSVINITKINGTITQFIINTAKIDKEANYTKINIRANKTGSFQMYKVIDNDYKKINKEDDFSPVKVNKFLIVRFMTKDEEGIRFKLNFNNVDENEEISYGIVLLPTDQIEYLPKVSSFNSTQYNIKTIKLKENNFEEYLDNKYYQKDNDNNNDNYIAFILSSKKEKINNVTINEDKVMTYFLYGSIILALIFAVITFFLIRRKQNISNDVENEDNQDDNDK